MSHCSFPCRNSTIILSLSKISKNRRGPDTFRRSDIFILCYFLYFLLVFFLTKKAWIKVIIYQVQIKCSFILDQYITEGKEFTYDVEIPVLL